MGGMKFFPQEVELALESHPLIRAASVFAHSDSRLGEVPHAYIVSEDPAASGPDDLRKYCISRLASYKVPERFISVKTLPTTASGKRIRREIQ